MFKFSWRAKLLKKIEQAGLLGRGCGTFPVAKKWAAVLAAPGKEKYVICNISESEPGIFKDKFIIENYPEKVIDGILVAMDFLKATRGFIYLNPTYYQVYKNKLQILIGDNNIELFSKPAHDYIGGEESALINLMEGQREEPRLRPPYVTTQGFKNAPTLVNNCETFYAIALISQDKYQHKKFFCISGDQTPETVLSLPETTNLQDALAASGYYPTFSFFVQLGGAMAGECLRAEQLKNYTIQHASGLVVHQLDKDEHKLIQHWLNFFAGESCGKCVTCREGTYRLREMYAQGNFDQQLFSDIIFSMQHTALCSLGSMAVKALTSYYQNIKKQPLDKISATVKKCDF